MAEDKSPEMVAFARHEGRRDSQPVKAGRRKIFKEANAFGLSKVKEGVINNLNYCEQDLSDEQSLSKRWKHYLEDNVKATGALTADKTLVWFPSASELLPTEDLLTLAMEMHPRLPILATFRFGEKPTSSRLATGISITANAKEYTPFAEDLADYFVRSVGESDLHALSIESIGDQKPIFSGSTHEYFRFHKADN